MKFFDSDNMGFEIAAETEALVAAELGSDAEVHYDFNSSLPREAMDEIRGRRQTAMARQLDHEILSAEDQKTLVLEAQRGCEIALEFLVRHQQRLIANVARGFAWAGQRNGMDMNDLRQEGNVGLMSAVWKWDPDKNSKFSSYATFWIRSAIMSALGTSSFVKLPHWKALLASRLPGLYLDLESELGRRPTGDEILSAVHERDLDTGFRKPGQKKGEVLTVQTINELMHAKVEVDLEGHESEGDGEIRPWAEIVSETARVLDDRGWSNVLQDTSDPAAIAEAKDLADKRKEFIKWLVRPLTEVETAVLIGHTVLGMSFKALSKQDFAKMENGKSRTPRGLGFAWKRAVQKSLDHANEHGISQQQVRTLLTA